jgi:hypothetical protein
MRCKKAGEDQQVNKARERIVDLDRHTAVQHASRVWAVSNKTRCDIEHAKSQVVNMACECLAELHLHMDTGTDTM